MLRFLKTVEMGTTTSPSNSVPKTLKDFLELTPPEVSEEVSDALEQRSPNANWVLSTPDLFLYCEKCEGFRFYECTDRTLYVPNTKIWARGFLKYLCRNCEEKNKFYALSVIQTSNVIGTVYKYGELPIFGPVTPARVITLIGPDRDIFLLGRRSENHGLGIGAFAYYRRVVENQKGRIIREIAKVAKKLGASDSVLESFKKAGNETQFTTAIDDIKDGLPTILRIDGHNPLTLLHKALSEGLHAKDDATCLELSASIRIVLTELAERISSVLKDHQELMTAVTKLLNRKTAESPPPQTGE